MKVFCGFFDAFLGTFYDFCEKMAGIVWKNMGTVFAFNQLPYTMPAFKILAYHVRVEWYYYIPCPRLKILSNFVFENLDHPNEHQGRQGEGRKQG